MKLYQPKCKCCKERFTPRNSTLQKYCMDNAECIKAFLEDTKQKRLKAMSKEWKEHVKKISPTIYARENKQDLRREINKLARLIDLKFDYTTCIDCGKPYGKQQDAAHYHSRGANSTLSLHLDNIHSAASHCNRFSDKHKPNYTKGLEARYGKDYLDHVEALPVAHPKIKLSEVEIAEKVKTVRKLLRDFSTFQFTDALQARSQLNKLIGIY